jgi:hypothetical protein
MVAVTDKSLLTAPPAADPVSVTAANSSWANSSWAQITAGLGVDALLQSVICDPGALATEFEFDIGTGPGGAEVVRATFRAHAEGDNRDGAPHEYHFQAPFKVPVSTRIAARVRKSATGTPTYRFAITYIEAPAGAAPLRPSFREVTHRPRPFAPGLAR